MESTKKKPGRPKSEPRTGPLVLEEVQKRETILTEVSADTAQELSEYAAWVKESVTPAKMTPAEAISKTIDFALRNLFARDRRWREYKRKGGRAVGTGETVPPAAATPAPTSPSPVSRTPTAPSPLPPPGGREGRSMSQTGS